MTGPGQDELQGGSEREPVLPAVPPWLGRTAFTLVAVAVLAVLVVAVLRLDRAGTDASPGPPSPGPPSSGPSSTASGDDGLVVAASGAGPLAVGAICTHTDGSRRLLVQFQVANQGIGRVTVLAVRPVLPLGGLVPTGVTMPRSPSCGTPAARTRGSTVLEPGQRVGVQLAFRLPRRCPAPYPVQADVDLMTVGENPGTQRVFLLNDLGGVRFDTCPSG